MPYNGASDATLDTMTGQISIKSDSVGASLPLAESNQLKPLPDGERGVAQ